LEKGLDYFKSDAFWEQYKISFPQVEFDLDYLYGLLQAATKGRANPYLVHHRTDRNGLEVWIKFEKTYAHDGSKTIKSEELEEKVFQLYDVEAYGGIVDYIDHFET